MGKRGVYCTIVFLTIYKGMPLWCENVSECTLDEVASLRNENRAWHKELRRQTGVLVDGKLAKRIGQEEYVAERTVANAAIAECQRRGRIIASEIMNRRWPVKF